MTESPFQTFQVRFPEHTSGVFETLRIPGALDSGTARVLAASSDTDSANTYSWDTVFAIKFPDVNARLRQPGATPAKFSASDTGLAAHGEFGPWQLSGGSGDLLHMTVPVTKGSMVFEEQVYPMDGAVATLEIQLEFLPRDDTAAATDGTLKDLKVRLQADSKDGKAVSVTDFDITPSPGTVPLALMTGILAKWFNDNLKEFTHVFSTVDLNMKADREQFAWLKPTDHGYGVYKRSDNPDESVFGVMCMTEKRLPPGNNDVSPQAIPAGARSGFLISKERFLEKLVLPGLPALFDGATLDDFEIAEGGSQIRNKNPLKLEPVKIGLVDYTPEIDVDNCTVTLNNNEVEFQLQKAHVAFSPGIDIYMYYTGYSAIELVTRSDGSKALNYKEARPPVIDHTVDVAAWVVWTEVAASVGVAVATLGAGAFAKKVIERITLRVVATIITLVVGELIANISGILDAIAEGDKDKLPPVDLVMANATNAITWPGSKEWTPTSAQVNGPLQFGGDPHFVD